MHVGKIYTHGNIVYHNESIAYYYQIKPINSLFASVSQQTTLLKNMVDKILSVNMQGMLFIKPVPINNEKIIQAYESTYEKNGKPEFLDMKNKCMNSIKKILNTKVRYRYEIYMIISDGREALKRRKGFHYFKGNPPMTERILDIAQIANEEIYRKLSKDLSVTKLTDKQVVDLHQYISIPFDQKIIDYFVTETPTEIEYSYLKIKKYEYEKLYSRTLVASSFEEQKVSSDIANDIINTLQLESFPSDTFVKFDLEHTKKFKNEMSGKKELIEKQNKRLFRMAEKKDKKSLEAKQLAQIGEEVDESIEDSKIRWQMFIRIRSNDLKMLNLRAEKLRRKFSGAKIVLSSEIGEQLNLANHLFPYRTTYHRNIQTTDIAYFARYNYLGGLYIGEENEGIILTYTNPGNLPVFIDISAPLKGQTKKSSSTIVFSGETGSGKTQLADHLAFILMVFYGMRILTIDPKDDRAKKVQLLGDKATRLVIGSQDCPNGMFDCYLMYPDDFVAALAKAKNDVTSLVRAVNPGKQINLFDVDRAHADMMVEYKAGNIKQPTFSCLVDHYKTYDQFNGEQLLSLMNDPYGRLFFANDETRIDTAFNLRKSYNLVTFADMPLITEDDKIGDYNPNELKHRIFSVVFNRMNEIVNGFMKIYGGEENVLLVDEYKVFKSLPGGEEVVENCNRQARSWLTHLFILTQNPSDVSQGIMNNIGQSFIGSLSSNSEIETILSELNLGDHSTIKEVLHDNTKDEGVSEEKKYNFLYVDYNNRKCITKNIILDAFKDSFSTLKKDEKDVPVTGTKSL